MFCAFLSPGIYKHLTRIQPVPIQTVHLYWSRVAGSLCFPFLSLRHNLFLSSLFHPPSLLGKLLPFCCVFIRSSGSNFSLFPISGNRHNLVLVSSGLVSSFSCQDGLTPLHCAARSGHDQAVELLLERGAPLLARTKVSHCE